MTQPSDEFLALQAALAGEYSLQRELGRAAPETPQDFGPQARRVG